MPPICTSAIASADEQSIYSWIKILTPWICCYTITILLFDSTKHNSFSKIYSISVIELKYYFQSPLFITWSDRLISIFINWTFGWWISDVNGQRNIPSGVLACLGVFRSSQTRSVSKQLSKVARTYPRWPVKASMASIWPRLEGTHFHHGPVLIWILK